MNPDKNDVKYWEKITEKYNDFIKEAKLDGKRLDPPRFPTGSIEEWAYYQYGVPTFAFDFWTLPKPEKKKKETDSTVISLDSLENMSSEDVIALGEENITKLLEVNQAPKMYTAERVIKGLESDRMNPNRMAEMLRKMSEKDDDEAGGDETEEALIALKPGSFLEWQPYEHPTLGMVEIGGMIPFEDITPPDADVSDLINKQLPFIKELTGMLPDISIEDVKITKESSDIWKVEAWVTNSGFLPYPTHQGKRCGRPAPIAVTIDGNMTILDGRARKPLGLLDGSGGVTKVSWLVQASAGKEINLELFSFSAGVDKKTVTLKEGGAN